MATLRKHGLPNSYTVVPKCALMSVLLVKCLLFRSPSSSPILPPIIRLPLIKPDNSHLIVFLDLLALCFHHHSHFFFHFKLMHSSCSLI